MAAKLLGFDALKIGGGWPRRADGLDNKSGFRFEEAITRLTVATPTESAFAVIETLEQSFSSESFLVRSKYFFTQTIAFCDECVKG
jgi:hypothetical protein